jgi:putative ubiquitin-RnfH superfamily antitoxin RatB of RatAB toxin-antitoxin module
MQVGVAYSEAGQQIWLTIEVPDDSTVRQAIDRSGILKSFPTIDLQTQKVGVFGRLVKLDTGLRPATGSRSTAPSPATRKPSRAAMARAAMMRSRLALLVA